MIAAHCRLNRPMRSQGGRKHRNDLLGSHCFGIFRIVPEAVGTLDFEMGWYKSLASSCH